MINRPRTAFVSVDAVAVSMIVLGSDARAKSGPAASPQKYVRYLEKLAEGELKNGTSLMQRLSSLESTLKRLENTPNPSHRLAGRIAAQEKTIYNQELKVSSKIQKNANALLAIQADLQALPSAELQALPPKQQQLVTSLLNSIQTQVASDTGVQVATPTR